MNRRNAGSSRCDERTAQRGVPTSSLGISQKMVNINSMPAVAAASMIRRQIGDDHICVLTFDRPESGANIFDGATLAELSQHLDFIENDGSLGGLIITSAKKSIFIAGADLKTLLQQAQSGDMRAFTAQRQRIFNRLAALKIPTIAAIHGACAGGGYEVTLACDYRIASDDAATRIGLPETTLGLIPAWGGCTRLPRLIGVEKAAEVILRGKLYSAQEASRLGLVDEIASRDQLMDPPREKVVHAGVLGAGIIGSGIARWLSSRGVTVILRDIEREQIDYGLANSEKIYSEAVKRGLMTEAKAKEGRARICGSTAPMELRDVQFVIEAASEKINVKKEIFCKLAMEAGPKTIVATNTSALPVRELADVTVSPDHVIGLHFFNPVSRMKLVEVVVANETSDETRDRSLAFVRQVGKLPVVVRDSPGFLVNRVLFPYLLDAAERFEAGLDTERIDNALVKWGMPMGPLRLIDEIGVDICIDIGNTLEKAYGRRDHVPAVLRWLRDRRMLGRKSGAGFYRYEGKTQTPNELLAQWRRGLHGEPEGAEGPNIPSDLHRDPRLRLNEEDLARRLVLLMANEAARCVEEKVVDSPEDADYGMILGTGFSPFRGGPLRYAEHLGLNKVVDELERLARTEEKFLACEILKKHSRDGTRFYAD